MFSYILEVVNGGNLNAVLSVSEIIGDTRTERYQVLISGGEHGSRYLRFSTDNIFVDGVSFREFVLTEFHFTEFGKSHEYSDALTQHFEDRVKNFTPFSGYKL